MKKNILQKEKEALTKKRVAYLNKFEQKKDIAPQLQEKVPKTLKATLNSAFAKAFWLIFEKGTGIIEKTYSKEEAQAKHKVNKYAIDVNRNRKSLRGFSRQSNLSGAVNLLASGVEGITMGIVGCGLPDIPLFTGMILRSLYEISANYGYDYTLPEEKYYQLLIIKGAMSYGDDLKETLDELDSYALSAAIPTKEALNEMIKKAAEALAEEMLFLKFVQGIPIVGVVGGASDVLFLSRIQRFAKLNYQYRMLNGIDSV